VWVLWIVLGIVVLGAIFGVVAYNRFVSQKQLIKDSWANIDTELRRRYDLIPNLVETVRGYATHEREVFENVTKARANAAAATGTPAAQAAAEGPLVAALRQLFAVVENYPDLKANQNFIANMFHFQQEEYFEVDEALREAGAPQVNFTGAGPSVNFESPAVPGGAPAAPPAPPTAPATSPPPPPEGTPPS